MLFFLVWVQTHVQKVFDLKVSRTLLMSLWLQNNEVKTVNIHCSILIYLSFNWIDIYMLNVCAKQYIIVIQYAIPKLKQNNQNSWFSNRFCCWWYTIYEKDTIVWIIWFRLDGRKFLICYSVQYVYLRRDNSITNIIYSLIDLWK